RELENVIEYGYAVCRGRILEFQHLPQELQAATQSVEAAPEGSISLHPAKRLLDEEAQIRAALERHNGNRSAISRELNIDRTTLWRKMRRYGITYPF
ncbi:Fis family transcriptional regulator, partial [bacterium]|nr:Fis family transcriptional regulator [bacterium]